MKKENPLFTKSLNLSLEVIKLHDELVQGREYIISRQLIRSATSIGANIRESNAAQSRKDFINKLAIASKEAIESEYWLELLFKSQKISLKRFKILINLVIELRKMLSSSIKTSKAKLHN